MICPECGSEYREGYVRCSDCETDLVEPPPVEPEVALVKVYETGNAALIPLFESLLGDAGIEYMTKSEGVQDLFGWGRFGAKMSYLVGPVEFFVREEAAAEALAIAETLALPVPDEPA
ncbi:MAG TPA: DUF2007 domain-containing protein, partial [Thermoanaerobaculia bacterium]